MQPGERYAKNRQEQRRQAGARAKVHFHNAQRQELATLARRAQLQGRELELLRKQVEAVAKQAGVGAGPQVLPGDPAFAVAGLTFRQDYVQTMERLRRKLNALVTHPNAVQDLEAAQGAVQGHVSSGLEAVVLLVVLAEKLSQLVAPEQGRVLRRVGERAQRIGAGLRRLLG